MKREGRGNEHMRKYTEETWQEEKPRKKQTHTVSTWKGRRRRLFCVSACRAFPKRRLAPAAKKFKLKSCQLKQPNEKSKEAKQIKVLFCCCPPPSSSLLLFSLLLFSSSSLLFSPSPSLTKPLPASLLVHHHGWRGPRGREPRKPAANHRAPQGPQALQSAHHPCMHTHTRTLTRTRTRALTCSLHHPHTHSLTQSHHTGAA